MIIKNLKKAIQLMAMIFTSMILIELAAGQALDNRVLCELLLCAVLASLIKFCFFKGMLFEYSIWRQSAYLAAVWMTGMACNIIFNWGMTVRMNITILAMVILIYAMIRFINYQMVKIDAKKMNEQLKKRKDL